MARTAAARLIPIDLGLLFRLPLSHDDVQNVAQQIQRRIDDEVDETYQCQSEIKNCAKGMDYVRMELNNAYCLSKLTNLGLRYGGIPVAKGRVLQTS